MFNPLISSFSYMKAYSVKNPLETETKIQKPLKLVEKFLSLTSRQWVDPIRSRNLQRWNPDSLLNNKITKIHPRTQHSTQ